MGTELSTFDRPLEAADSRQALLELQTKIGAALAHPTGKASAELLEKLHQHITEFIVFADGGELSAAKYQQFDESVLGLFPYTMQRLNTGLQAYEFSLADIPDYISSNWLSPSGVYKIIIDPKYDLNKAENLKAFAIEVQSIDDSVTGLPAM